jgi:chemotaxis-related protein WspB
MLWIGFQVGDERYALRARDIVEVIPRVTVRPVAAAPPSVLGLFTYRGRATPVIDLGMLLKTLPVADRFSSRILMVALSRGGHDRHAGLLAEKVTDVREDAGDLQPALALAEAPFLGGVLVRGPEIVQAIEPSRLLSDDLWSVLFPPEEHP